MPPCSVKIGGESVHVIVGMNPRRSGCLSHTLSVRTVGNRGMI